MADSFHIVCPQCSSVNRVASERLPDMPMCGRCKQPLFSGQPIGLDGAAFAQHLSRNDIPLLIDFWAPWCGPCKMMAPAFAQAALQLEPQLRLAKVNTEEEQALAAQFNIRSIPTLVLFKNGTEMARQAGAMGAADIVRWARSQL